VARKQNMIATHTGAPKRGDDYRPALGAAGHRPGYGAIVAQSRTVAHPKVLRLAELSIRV
jgi:hypothetical protein